MPISSRPNVVWDAAMLYRELGPITVWAVFADSPSLMLPAVSDVRSLRRAAGSDRRGYFTRLRRPGFFSWLAAGRVIRWVLLLAEDPGRGIGWLATLSARGTARIRRPWRTAGLALSVLAKAGPDAGGAGGPASLSRKLRGRTAGAQEVRSRWSERCPRPKVAPSPVPPARRGTVWPVRKASWPVRGEETLQSASRVPPYLPGGLRRC